MRMLISALAVALFAATAFGDEENRLSLTTEKVVVFKDGYCLVVKRAEGTANENGEVFTEEVPDAAVLGSFWAIPDEGRLLSMTAGVVETETEESVKVRLASFLDVLAKNVGKPCVLELDDGSTLSGTVSGTAGTLVLLAGEAEEVLLPASRIRRLSMRGATLEADRTVKTKKRTKRLTFRLDGGAGRRGLTVMYFRPGVRWIPTYRVSLSEDDAAKKVARVRLQAEILNEAEDLVDVPFDLVVGVPNFRFRSVVSPFVLERTLLRSLEQAAPRLMGQAGAMSNALFTQRRAEHRPGRSTGDAARGGSVDFPEELTAGRSQDLFVYHLPPMTLEKGHRAAVPVFEARVPYRDVYTWDLHLARHDVEAAPSGSLTGSPLALSTNRVWHTVELSNSTDVPWTTGAAMIMRGHQPLAQELLTYTSADGTVRLPVTVAVDVRAEFSEEETGRDRDALKWDGHMYVRIDKLGRLRVTNRKKEAIVLEVLCGLGGRVDEATHDGKVTIGSFESSDWLRYRGSAAVNNHSIVAWKLDLAAGETIAPTVKFHYFTRRY